MTAFKRSANSDATVDELIARIETTTADEEATKNKDAIDYESIRADVRRRFAKTLTRLAE